MTTRMTEQPRWDNQNNQHNDDNVDDITFLNNKTSRQVTQVLSRRLYNNQTYTKIGARVLISLNPNTESHEDKVELYTKEPTSEEPLDAHIYQLASVVYFHLTRSGIDQSVVFYGDSGSGKSHSLRKFIKFMSVIRHKSNKEKRLYEHINHTDALFKSFACAATVKHSDASRVGRYMELQFDDKGRTIGVKHLDYLFEKERVVHVPNGESNFHVFYQLLNGLTAEERNTFKLNEVKDYHFLQGTNSPYVAGTLESQFHELKTHLKALGFNRQSQSQIFQLLASILHLGNIGFVNQISPTEPAVIRNPETMDIAADFLGLMPTTLEGLLTYKTVLIKKEMCTVFLNADDAMTQRDDLAKCLYSLLFAWILEHINSRLCKETQTNFIGLLDLPGFQSRSQPNSFEGFLVNYSNERLFNYCCFQVFEASNAAYEEDGIPTINIEYKNNQQLVHLLGKPGTGIVSIIDRQANRAKGPASDSALMQALAKGHGTDDLLSLDRGQSQFTINHFAQPVVYSVSGFMESNCAAIGTDFVLTFRGGLETPVGNPFVAGLFKSEAITTKNHPKNMGTIVSAQQPNIPLRQPSMKRARVKADAGDNKAEKPIGAAVQFQIAMDELFDTFDNTEAWFVFCLMSNLTHSPRRIDSDLITQQVERYSLVNMAQRKEIEYTVCYQHEEFVNRYNSVLEAASITTNRPALDVLQATKALFGWEAEHMAIGTTFTYLCDGIWRDLEENLKSNEKFGPLPAFMADDNRSFYSDDDQGSFFERESKFGSQDGDLPLTKAENQLLLDNEEEEDEDDIPKTKIRKSWICFTWAMTWWIPSCALSCCGMKLKEVRMAWREKVTLCFLIFFLCAAVVLFIVGINPLICPTRQIFSAYEISAYNTAKKPLVSVNGKVFNIAGLSTHYGTQQTQLVKVYAGNDVSFMFPFQLSSLCTKYDGTQIDESVSLSNTTLGASDKNAQYHDHRYYRGSGYYQPDWYQNAMSRMQQTIKAGDLAVDPTTLQKKASNNYFWVLLNGKIYDLNNYVIGNVYTLTPPDTSGPSSPSYSFMDPNFIDLVRAGSGKDITLAFNQMYAKDPATKAITLQCLNNVFYGGVLDDRQSFRCVFAQYILLALSIFLFAILFVKFLASLQLGSRPEPEDHDKFIVCNVPCYTEGEESLKKTIDSLAVLKYDDKRKLLFIVADGMVMGGGNDLPTPRIVLDILGADSSVDPEPLSFFSLGDGMKQHNMAKVYTGLYECMGHVVPYLVVVKVGRPSERAKPGNRGKRDSQMILMRFFNKVHYDHPMAPLELEMYHQVKNVIGVDPHFYEFVLMVDADTTVMPDALNRLVSAMLHDTKIMGQCGETALANEKDTWATMIQVYEYFISHHLAKAFESLFGSVTCLPGCFCMYRMRAINNQPLLVSNVVINDYSENRVDTLHKKNLLHLGEDRYLTTLMLKHFPFFKMTFTPDAMCLTNAPDTWGVLLSQRRRWINSTVHNLLELVFLPRLCGFCCFSMRFVVFMDLLSTIIMPATLGYLGYLVYRLITDSSSIPIISLLFIIAPYALQMIVFILRRQWQHIGWMIVYLLALPVFAFFIPLYAFWHFDDFSWGNTRVVVGDNGRRKKILVATGVDDGKFDPRSIPTKKWSEYEEEIWEAGTELSQDSKPSRGGGYPYSSSIHHDQDYNNLGNRSSQQILASPTQMVHSPTQFLNSSSQPLTSPSQPFIPYSRPGSRANLSSNFDHRPPSPAHPRYSTASQVPLPSASFGAIPSPDPGLESEILLHVRQILNGVDLMSVSKKQIREQLSQQLGRDMTPHRELVNRCIERCLAGP